MANRPWNKEVEEKFLTALESCGLIHRSCEIAGIIYSTLRNHCDKDPDFSERVDLAHQKYNESLELEVHRRGFAGYDEPVFGKDKQIGTKKKYSDALALAHIRKRIPAYRDKPFDLNVQKGGVLVVGGRTEDADEWAKNANEEKKTDAESEGPGPEERPEEPDIR